MGISNDLITFRYTDANKRKGIKMLLIELILYSVIFEIFKISTKPVLSWNSGSFKTFQLMPKLAFNGFYQIYYFWLIYSETNV